MKLIKKIRGFRMEISPLLPKRVTLLKCFTFLLCFSILQSFTISKGYSQTVRISLNVNNATVKSILSQIEQKSKYYFTYNVEEIDVDRKTSIQAENTDVTEILNTLFDGQNVKYSINERHITLYQVSVSGIASISQPKKKIEGVVKDTHDMPIIGASVMIKGTSQGTVTNLDGLFTLDVSSTDVLLVSYIGFNSREIPVGSRNNFNIILEEDTKVLDEVVVVGYGTMQRRAVTSSITSIKASDMVQGLGGATVATALRGKIAGLTISGNDSPNASNDFQLRGIASVNAGQSPLVVIDGIPGGDLRAINQEDIVSIDVLKDASAGAIYGTRAAGGVILITTKQAEEGPMKLSYTGEFVMETVRKGIDVLNAKEFIDAGLGTDYGHDTNWFDEITNSNPFSTRHVITMAGGSPNSRVYSSFTYQDLKGLAIDDGRKDYTGRVNTDFRFFDNFLEVKTHSTYRHLTRNEAGGSSQYQMALKLNPTESAYDPENITGYNVMRGGFDYYNPLADIKLRDKKSINKYLMTDAVLKVNLLPELYAQGTIAYQSVSTETQDYISAYHKESVDNNLKGNAYLGHSKSEIISTDFTVNYFQTFAAHHDINAVVGYSFEERNGDSFNMRNRDFPVNNTAIWDIGKGSYLTDGKASMASNKKPRERLISFFGRANYSYKDKYMMTASLRHEGSSKFGPNNKWGDFWSVSAGWRISEEAFMQYATFINDLKLRIGYGVVGNNGFSAGNSTRMYGSDAWWLLDGKWVMGYGSKHNVNPDLKWEEKKEWNIGLDYSLLNNRLYGKFDLYQRKVEGMLYEIAVPVPPNVHKTTIMNTGDLENKGWEFEIGGTPVMNKDFNYSTSLRLSKNTSKIKTLWGSQTYQDRKYFPSPGAPGYAVRLNAGSTIGKYFLWEFAGFDDNGEWLLYDANNKVIPAKDRKIEDKKFMGNAIPKLIVSWDHSLEYKNWDMSINLRSWIGHDVFNMVEMYYGIPNIAGQNVLKETYEKNKHIKGEKQLTNYFLQDGTFLKIDAVNIGYNLDLRKYYKHLGKARIYLTIRDLACFTKYKGMDPEVNINGLDPGFDSHESLYPKTRRFTLGVQLNF